jgi:hypothetical protein
LDNYSLIISIFGQNLRLLHIKGETGSRGIRRINLLSVITTRCENLEELRISGCSDFDEYLFINENNNVINNFQIRSKLKYLKFEDCSQRHLLDAYPLVTSICGQNLQYLYIRGKEILSATRNIRNINLLLIISRNCFNLKLLKISIINKYIGFIPKLFSSCQKLQHVTFNTYDQKELINIDLSEIGETIPLSMKRFTMKMNLYFTPENFKEFLINSKDKINLEVLNFRECELFSDDHLNMLIKYGNGYLKRFKINNAIKVDNESLSKANQFVKIEGPKFLESIPLP